VTVGTREDNERCVETMRLALQRLAPRKSHIEMHPSAVPVARASASDAELEEAISLESAANSSAVLLMAAGCGLMTRVDRAPRS
jgi:hypothetical protein